MGIVGAEVAMPLGEPWRAGKRPYGRDALSVAAACLKGFYLHQASLGVNSDLGGTLSRTRLPSRADRRRSFLGHVKTAMPANPLAPRGPHRRHPKMLPDGARARLLAGVNSARDRLVVTWLADGGLRIGELCGLHLADLHLRDGAACGQCRAPHVHVCHRPGNPNGAEAKTKLPWRLEGGTVTGGLIKRVSPAMVHAYFELHDRRVSPRPGISRDAAGPAARGERRAAVGAGGSPPDARPGRGARRAGQGETARFPALVHERCP